MPVPVSYNRGVIQPVQYMKYFTLPVCLILSAVIIPFLGLVTGTHDFVSFDDLENIVNNPNFKGLNRDNLDWMLTSGKLGVYEPVSWLLKSLQHGLFGSTPRVYHATTLLLHLINTLLVYLCFAHLLRIVFQQATVNQILITAAVSAFFFGIHPLRVEVVAWASGQSYAVGALFFLASILTYLRYRQGPKYASLLALSVVLYSLAVLGKSAMVMLPAWIILLDIVVYRRSDYRTILLEKIPFAIVGIVTVAVVVLINDHAMGDSHRILPWPEKFGRAILATGIYPVHSIWPPNLSPFHPLPQWGFKIWDKIPLLITFLLLALSFIAIRLFPRNRWILAMLLAYFAMLLPVLGFIQHGVPALSADRYTYISTLPFFLGLGGLWLGYRDRISTANLGRNGMIALAVLLSWLTIQQVAIWKNSRTLWTHALAVHPGNALALNNYGFDFWLNKEYETARDYLEQAVLIDPGYEHAMINLGVTYYELDRCDLAIELYQRAALDHHKYSQGLFHNLGNCYLRLGQLEQAVAPYQRVLELNPNHTRAKNALNLVLKQLGRAAE